MSKDMANPEGFYPRRAQAREPYQNFDGGGLHRNQLHPLARSALPLVPKVSRMIGEGLGEWFEAPSYEEGVGVDGSLEALPSEKER